jgi:hypothetical protein
MGSPVGCRLAAAMTIRSPLDTAGILDNERLNFVIRHLTDSATMKFRLLYHPCPSNVQSCLFAFSHWPSRAALRFPDQYSYANKPYKPIHNE